jgi:UDP-N-acetylglucosamine 2-epimerase
MDAKTFKIAIIVGTRPEIIRLARVIDAFHKHTDLCLVHTGQNYDYELNRIFFDDLGIPQPKHFLNAAGNSAIETIAQILLKIDPVLELEKPDAVLVLGDTNSCISVLAAKRRKIPVFHMEAGNRCFDQRVPEEINRRIVDHISDINLTYSEQARQYLLREGLPPDRVIKTGTPMYEVLSYFSSQIDQSSILGDLGIDYKGFFLVSTHREENIETHAKLQVLRDLLNYLAGNLGKPVIVSTHPRTRNRFETAGCMFHHNVRLMKPFGYFDYNKLQKSALVVLSDSGTITEESSILNFPALNIREAHERPEGMDEGNVMLTGLNLKRIKQCLAVVLDQPRGEERLLNIPKDYVAPNVAEKVVRIVLSYTDYIHRTVWQRTLDDFQA